MMMQKLLFSSYTVALLALFSWVILVYSFCLTRSHEHAVADEKTQGNQFLSTSAQTSPAVLTERTDNGSIQNRPATNSGIFSIGGYGCFYICLNNKIYLILDIVVTKIWF